jgi:hypothetical protein
MEAVSEETEEIDIDVPLTSEDESDDETLRHRSRHRETEHDDPMQLNATTDPLYNLEHQEKVPSTADIRHFFERTSDGTVCKFCK